MLNTFLLSMRGTPYTYYGDELGMTNLDMPKIEEYVDVAAIGDYKTAQKQGKDMQEFMTQLNFYSRENGRTPMQWNDSAQGGFTQGTPWKKVNPNYTEINVAVQEKDSNSVLNHFRKMVQLRKENEGLIYGKYQLIQQEHPQVYAYTRTLGQEKWLVLLNFSSENTDFDSDLLTQVNEVKMNNYEQFNRTNNKVTLLPYQALVISLL
ncbi:MAG: alpha-glucosidase C-terminal domain-containing protein [Bacteroidota bacterium]